MRLTRIYFRTGPVMVQNRRLYLWTSPCKHLLDLSLPWCRLSILPGILRRSGQGSSWASGHGSTPGTVLHSTSTITGAKPFHQVSPLTQLQSYNLICTILFICLEKPWKSFFSFRWKQSVKWWLALLANPCFFISPDYAGPPDSKKSNLDIPNRFLSWWKNNTCLPMVATTKWRGCRWEDPNRQSFVIAREIESVSKKTKGN